jgi:DNA-binding response OmpR family regulator
MISPKPDADALHMRVLLVEDDPWWAETVELMLRQGGHAYRTATLGKAAIEYATQEDFDLVILDIMLPDTDGYEVIERLRTAKVRTPILVQSGLVVRRNEDDARAFGVDEIIIKPFGRDELAKRMRSAVARGEPTVAGAPTDVPRSAGAESKGASEMPRSPRSKRIKAAQMIHHKTAASCMVLNLSGGGAAIRLPRHLRECPPVFTLKLDTGDTHRCEVCWRLRDKVGVKFLSD